MYVWVFFMKVSNELGQEASLYNINEEKKVMRVGNEDVPI